MTKCIIIKNDALRFDFTNSIVNENDIIKAIDTDKIYKVIDVNNLDNEKGYSLYSGEVSWSNLVGKPTEFPPSKHSHDDYLSSSGGTINGDLNVTGEIIATGNITAFSDERVKQNIRDIDDNVIEKLKQVKFHNFEYINFEDNRKRVGVIAQELEELFPELIYSNKDGIKCVDYIGLNTYFSFAIQKKLLGL